MRKNRYVHDRSLDPEVLRHLVGRLTWLAFGLILGLGLWWAWPDEGRADDPNEQDTEAVDPLPLASKAAPLPDEPENSEPLLPSYQDLSEKIIEPVEDSAETEAPEEAVASDLKRKVKGEIKRGETLSTSFARMELDFAIGSDIAEALKGVFDLRKCQPGNKWELSFDTRGEVETFTYHYKTLESYYVRREGGVLQGYGIEGETTMYVVPVSGSIEQSLSTSVWRFGEGNQLTHLIANIFAWDVDFYSDVRKGDQWRVLVEKHFYNGKFIKYGRVLAAYYKGEIVGDLYAYFFESTDSARAEYFDDNGNALQKSFLRAPLDTTRVTSKFGFRMHPTLKRYQKHNGVDYGAPIGTPIWAIANGKVMAAGWMGPCGKGVRIRHANGYESVYCHMSSIVMRGGQRVNQKQLVGRVGTTGRSTGPHLHFGLKKNGVWQNPLKIKYEPGKPLEKKYRDRWKEARELLRGKLEAISIASIAGPEPPPDWTDPKRAEPKKQVAKKKRKSRKKSKSSGFRPRPEGIKRARDAG